MAWSARNRRVGAIWVGSVLLLAALLGIGLAAPNAARADGPPEKPRVAGGAQEKGPEEGAFTVFTGEGDEATASTDPVETRTVAGTCNYETKGDYSHMSSTGWAASAHGWWLEYGGCPSTAWVTVYLQAWYCTNGSGCWWQTIATGRQQVVPGGGSGNRATARHDCSSSTWVTYRSIVDVDLVGVVDPPDQLVTQAQSLPCYPS